MRNKLNLHWTIFVFCGLVLSITACKSTKPTVETSYDELYQTWRIDSVYMEGSFIPNSELKNGTIEFTRENRLITKTGKRENSITFALDDNKVINKDRPTDPPLAIEQLSKEQLILKSATSGIIKLRMILSPIKH